VLLGVLWFATPVLGVDALGLAMFCSYGISLALHVVVLRDRLSLPLGFFATGAKTLACGASCALLGYGLARLLTHASALVRLFVGAVGQCAFALGGYVLTGVIKGGGLVRLRAGAASKKRAGRAVLRAK